MACSSCRRRKLKCDNGKPCNACSLSRRQCDYEIPRKRGPKRRTCVDMDAASSEDSPMSGFSHEQAISMQEYTVDNSHEANSFVQTLSSSNASIMPELGETESFSFALAPLDGPHFPYGSNLDFLDSTSWDLMDLGQFERMPKQDLTDHLTSVYFDHVHKYVPFVHQPRYLADMLLAPQAQPPMCLRYAIWTVASTQCQCHKEHTDIFYRRARQYLESDEMKSPPLTTIAHVQCWALVAFYESSIGSITRSWMSNRRLVALAQMLGLHQLDQPECYSLHKTCFRDKIDIEQGRRAFWAAFCSDRWASAGTGLPKAIDAKDIITNLPCSDRAFRDGTDMDSQSLPNAIEHGLLDTSPLFAGSVVAAHMMGQIMDHCNNVKDLSLGLIADQSRLKTDHRKLDNMLTQIFLRLPRRLRFSTAQRESEAAFFNACLQSASIYLHLAAVDGSWSEDNLVHQKRCRNAAEEVFLIMRMLTHLDASQMNPFTAFGLYTASTVLIRFFEDSRDREEDLDNLRFAIAMMESLEKHWTMISSFIGQIRHDLKKHNIDLLDSNVTLTFEDGVGPGTNLHLKPTRLLAGVLQHP